MSQHSFLIVPALAGREDDIEASLTSGESEGGTASGNSAAGKVGGAVGDAYHIDQEVLVGQVGGISADKEPGSSANGNREASVILGVVIRGALDILRRARRRVRFL